MGKQNLIEHEVLGSIILMLCAIFALVINNSPLSGLYNYFLDMHISVKINGTGLDKPILLWINDGLMAIFFLLVGLELKREILDGELSDIKKVILPVIGSIGGMLFPVLIYCFFNFDNNIYIKGWAIPMATDIAFALGVLSLFGKRVPIQLKLFLLTLAIIDDLGAILVIGLFHTHTISLQASTYALLSITILSIFNIFNLTKTIFIYLALGLILWVSTLESGFHATIAGVILALAIPIKTRNGKKLLNNLECDIKPLVTFFILPLFAFANSGIQFNNISFSDLYHPVVLGISIGLIIGNVIGILSLTILTKKLLKINLSYSYLSLIGVTFLCGIGFTMSLFISGLSFGNDLELLNLSRLAIISGSLISMIAGSIILYFSLPALKTDL